MEHVLNVNAAAMENHVTTKPESVRVPPRVLPVINVTSVIKKVILVMPSTQRVTTTSKLIFNIASE